MKRRVRAQVINADWEIKKFEIEKRANEVKQYLKKNAGSYAKCFAFGAGVAVVCIIRNEF